MTWRRPESATFPQVWGTFEAMDPDTKIPVIYHVQDLTQDRFEEVIHLMETVFLRDDAMCQSLDRVNEPKGRGYPGNFWRTALDKKITLVCFKEGSDEICGFNMLTVFERDSERKYEDLVTKEQQNFTKAVEFIRSKADTFNRHGVDKYLTAAGLVVVPKYRGLGLATEILKARICLGKALGLEVTGSVFTGNASQRAAAKAGYVEDYSVLFEDLAKKEPFVHFPNIIARSAKFMSCSLNK